MRKVLVMLAVLFFCSSICESAERFIVFPTVGRCTGNAVRYRSDPDTKSEILGQLNKSDRVIVLGRTAVNGAVWYEIESPKDDNTAFVFGKYIEPYYNETSQRMETVKLIVNILENYGITRDKASLYAGPVVRRGYQDNNYLVRVDAQRRGSSFGDIYIGDNVKKLSELLGEPEFKSDSEWEYRIGRNTVLIFGQDNGKITRLFYEE